MPKVSVYLPEDLYRAARAEKLPISELAQRASTQALQVSAVNAWVERMRARPPLTTHPIDVERLMDEVHEEFGA